MEKINIAKLLKDCPKGMELDCVLYDNVTLYEVNLYNAFPIVLKKLNGDTFVTTKYGQYQNTVDSKCIIFPKGKTTWEGFQRPFKDGDIVFYNDTIAIFKEWGDETLFRTYVTKYLCCDSLIDINVPLFGKSVRKEIRFATDEEKEKLFKAIRDNGYCWDYETKTLEKSIPNKFDITTLVPFESKVLIRNDETQKWIPAFWGYKPKYKYVTTFGVCNYCIPYEGNENLLSTNNDCSEFYKTWEE